MPTVVTKTVKSSGGDYTSLAAAEAGEQKNLVTADEQLDIECYASAAGDSTQVTVSGWTTDATRFIRITCPSGERHAGVWDAAKYHLSVTTSGTPGGCITGREAYTRYEYLQVRNLRATPPEYNDCIFIDTDTNHLVNSCICRDGFRGVTLEPSAPTGSEIRNTICYGAADAGARIFGVAGGITTAHNCTLIGVYGLKTTAATNYPVAKNVYVHGSTRGFATLTGADNSLVAKTNCTASDTTATNNAGGGGATNCTDSIAHSTTNFTNVTAGSENYSLPSGSGLIDDGVDLSGTFTIDIAGQTRGATFDVGAWEYVAAAAGAVFRAFMLLGVGR